MFWLVVIRGYVDPKSHGLLLRDGRLSQFLHAEVTIVENTVRLNAVETFPVTAVRVSLGLGQWHP
jgi:hypothetical protein